VGGPERLTRIDLRGVATFFDAREGVNISDDKKAELINSLLIVMTSDKETSPVLSISK